MWTEHFFKNDIFDKQNKKSIFHPLENRGCVGGVVEGQKPFKNIPLKVHYTYGTLHDIGRKIDFSPFGAPWVCGWGRGGSKTL